MDEGPACRACGSTELEPAGPPPGGRAVCARCGRCWEDAGRGEEVDTLSCPGCPRRGTCESRPTWLAETMTQHHVLSDGTPVLVRPLLRGDRFELATAFADLSVQSRRLRFFTVADELEPEDLDYLTSIDYHDHFAWVALLVEGPYPRGIGVGRYIRDPAEPATAEVAVTVVDAYQQRGLGTLLTRLLADVAVANGIRTFVSYVLWENRLAVELLASEGARVSSAEPGIARIEMDLPSSGAELAEPYVHRVLHTFAELLRDLLERLQRAG